MTESQLIETIRKIVARSGFAPKWTALDWAEYDAAVSQVANKRIR